MQQSGALKWCVWERPASSEVSWVTSRYGAGLVAAVAAAAGTGFLDLHPSEGGHQRFGLLPDPDSQIFAGGIFQAGDVVEVMVIQALVNGFE